MWDELNRWWGPKRPALPDAPLPEPHPEALAGPPASYIDQATSAGHAPNVDEELPQTGPHAPTLQPEEPDSSQSAPSDPALRTIPASPEPVNPPIVAPASDDPSGMCLDQASDEDSDAWPLPSTTAPVEVPPPPELADLVAEGVLPPRPRRSKKHWRRLTRPEQEKPPAYSSAQRILILDSWLRSGLPAKDFAGLVGLSKHTLYAWKKQFDRHGPAGLMEQPRGAKTGSRLPELTKRSILMIKEAHPDWGCERISHLLLRGPALPASPSAIARVLHEAGYELQETPTRPHPDKPRSFERARPNQLWQTDLFTFMLKRQNRRVYLVAFLDDHSRFIVSFGLHASQSAPLVLEVFRAGLAGYGAPEEVLTDNGSQYVTWRGESAFHKELTRRGIKQIVAAPRHPQTLGKIERFWGTLWNEFLEPAVFVDLADARARIAHFIDWYNFQRVHSGIGGLVPADRFFAAAPDVRRALQERVAANALDLARKGIPKPPFYVTGQLGGKAFSLHAEGERVFLTRPGEQRREVDLTPPAVAASSEELPPALCPDGSPDRMAEPGQSATDSDAVGPPGTSPVDAFLASPPLPPRGISGDSSGPKGGA